MKSQYIPLEKTGHFPKLLLDYINEVQITNQNESEKEQIHTNDSQFRKSAKNSLSAFYKYPPEIESFSQAIKDISSQKINRHLLVEVIEEQYLAINHKPTAISDLLKENTFTVCTGHQLCLFTGPLYFIYKIISTINLAEALKQKYPENNFIPVYWMASEDHDFDEVNHINLFGKKIQWNNKQGGALGKYSNSGIAELIAELKPLLGDSVNANELILLFENAYTKHADFSTATRFLVNEFFGQYGLIILDANDKRLKAEFSEVMLDDVFNNTACKTIQKTISNLEKTGYKSQVNPRDINLFYITDNQRIRIVKENNKFNILDSNIPFTEVELKKEMKSHPERFSPNVVMRPMYQQKILPNLAYVGGPGELAYWLEYKEIFDHYKIYFPMLIPRNFVMLVEASVSEKLSKLGLMAEDIFLPVSNLTEKYVSSISGEKISFNSEKEKLEKLYQEISNKVALVDASLVGAVNAELQKNTKSLDELEKKMLRAFKQKNETAVTQVEKIKEKLLPQNILQERHDNFIPFYLKHGKNFIDEIKVALDPFDKRFIILSEK